MIRKNWKEWLKHCKKKTKTGRYVYTIHSVLLTPFSYVKKKIKFECNTAASANS